MVCCCVGCGVSPMSVVCCLCLGHCLCMWHVAYVCGCCLCLWLLPVSAACHLHLVVTYVCSVLLMCAVIAYVCSISPMSGCRLRLWWVAYVCGCCLCVAAFTYIGLHVCLVVKNMLDSSWSVGPSGRIFSLSSSNRFTFSGDSPCKHNNV